MNDPFQPIAPRPAPVKTEGLVPWIRRNLFGDRRSAVTTTLLLAVTAATRYQAAATSHLPLALYPVHQPAS